MQTWTTGKTITILAGLALLSACSNTTDPLRGSYHGRLTVAFVPTQGAAATIGFDDWLTNVQEGDGLYLEYLCNLELEPTSDTAGAIPMQYQSCDVRDETGLDVVIYDLQSQIGTFQRVGDTLTVDFGGDYTQQLETGEYNAQFIGTFVPGTQP